MKNFNKNIELFTPRTKRAAELLKEIEEFNKKAEYFRTSKLVKKILNEELGTKIGEKYAMIGGDGKKEYVEEYISPGETIVEFRSSWDKENVKNGKIDLWKEFVRVKTDGKIGKSVDKRATFMPGFESSFEYKSVLRQMPDNFVPGSKKKFITLEEAIKLKPNADSVRVAKKLTELFAEQDLEIIFRMVHVFNVDKVYIDDANMDYKSFMTLFHEACIFFTKSLLSTSKGEKERYNNMIAAGYREKTKVHKIAKAYEKWYEGTGIKGARFEFAFQGNSLILWRMAKIRFCTNNEKGLVGVTEFNLASGKCYDAYNHSCNENKMWLETMDKFPIYQENAY